MSRPAILRDRQTEIALALVLFAASAYLMHDAFEARGKSRPLGLKLLAAP